jgi:hypothetical protein
MVQGCGKMLRGIATWENGIRVQPRATASILKKMEVDMKVLSRTL